MAEFALPANSKIGTGETYKAPAGAKNIKTFDQNDYVYVPQQKM